MADPNASDLERLATENEKLWREAAEQGVRLGIEPPVTNMPDVADSEREAERLRRENEKIERAIEWGRSLGGQTEPLPPGVSPKMTVDEAERSKRQAQALHEMAAISVSEAARASGEQAEGDRTAALSDSESRGQRGAGLTREQKTGWGVALIVLGVIIFIAVARDSGRRQEESRQFDQAVNRHIERQNRWKTGTMDEQYPPGTTWNYGSPSGATVFWLLLGLASVIGGIALLTSAQRPADQ